MGRRAVFLAGLFVMVACSGGDLAETTASTQPDGSRLSARPTTTAVASTTKPELPAGFHGLLDNETLNEPGRTASSDIEPMAVADPPGVYGTDADIEEALDSVMRRFNSAGLTLPALRIYVNPPNECKGGAGAFYRDNPTDRVELCTATYFVVLHELAHAWVDDNVTDATRQQFIDHIDLEVWNDNDVTWTERGVERAAQAIACGLLDPPLTRAEVRCCPERIEHHELLTGIPHEVSVDPHMSGDI